jgi:hypothetical protein
MGTKVELLTLLGLVDLLTANGYAYILVIAIVIVVVVIGLL